MKRNAARRLADRFKADCPDLADRSVRMVEYATGDHTAIYVYPRGPRGGILPRQRIGHGTSGDIIICFANAGDIIAFRSTVNNWDRWRYTVALPHMESDLYTAGRTYQPEFPPAEVHASIKWAVGGGFYNNEEE